MQMRLFPYTDDPSQQSPHQQSSGMEASLPDVAAIVTGLRSESESPRKLAVFQLQSLLADPTFADALVKGGGLPEIKNLVLSENGNTLAYALGSLNRLLELGLGWEPVGADVAARAVELVVNQPSINVLRNALYLLVLIVSRPENLGSGTSDPTTARTFESTALKPIHTAYDTLLESLVDKLSSADHALRGNALRLINALMRESIVEGSEEDFLNFVRRLQELDITGHVEAVMRGDAVTDLVEPVLEFQRLTKVVQKRWKIVKVDIENPKHSKALKLVHTSSFPPSYSRPDSSNEVDKGVDGKDADDMWRRLGFEAETPEKEFEETGLLGLMDLTEYVRRNPNAYQKAILEQSVQPLEQRCPLAKASLSTTMMLCEYFDVDHAADGKTEDVKSADLDLIVQPLALRWILLHAAALNAFLRLWKAAGATQSEFHKIEDLMVIFIKRVVDRADRKKTTEEVEQQFSQESLETVRQWQLEDLDAVYENAWGSDLRRVRDQLHTEATQFMQEQRIRCLLHGAWFPVVAIQPPSSDLNPISPGLSGSNAPKPSISSWRFVQLASNRQYLHYALHAKRAAIAPFVTDMPNRIDVHNITSVVSNVTATELPDELQAEELKRTGSDAIAINGHAAGTITKLTINGPSRNGGDEEAVLLALYTASSVVASEWLDGLLMLLDQQPITADTNKMIGVIEEWSLRTRMLNLTWEDLDVDSVMGTARNGGKRKDGGYSREGLDTNYWYDMGEV